MSSILSHVLFRTPPIFIAFLLAISACNNKDEMYPRGKEVVGGLCINCHAQGINGAPIIGNKKMWGDRLTQGIPTLIDHANNGYGLMPAKGGNDSLTEEDISMAVKYMVSRLD